MSEKLNKVDISALKFNQGAIVIFTAVAFVFNIKWLIAFVAVVLITGTIFPRAGLFKLIYSHITKQLNLIEPRIVEEDNTPHVFAQGMGGIFLTIAFLLLEFTNQQFIGWTLSLIVLVLAFVNLALNFCVGCFLYFQLNKLGIFPGKLSEKQHA